MPSKRSLAAPTSSPFAEKRARKSSTSIVKRGHRVNFDRLCTLHKWTPSEKVRDKLTNLLSLSGPRRQASELLPLAFVQFYPFIWVQDMLLLGYNEGNDSVWYKAHSSRRGIARGRYYNSAQENIKGKCTVVEYWQSWVDIFGIEKQGIDRSHEFFTGVYLILQKFPNLRYKTQKGRSRNSQGAYRETGIPEYPFNDDHLFMQDEPSKSNKSKHQESEADLEAEREDMPEQQHDDNYIKEEREGSYGDEYRSKYFPRPLSRHLSSRASSRGLGKSLSSQQDTPTGQTAGKRPSQYNNYAGSSVLSRPLAAQATFRANSRNIGKISVMQPDVQTAQTAKKRSGLYGDGARSSILSPSLSSQSAPGVDSRANKPPSHSHFDAQTAKEPSDLYNNDSRSSIMSPPLSTRWTSRANSPTNKPPSHSTSDDQTADERTDPHEDESGAGNLSRPLTVNWTSHAGTRASRASPCLRPDAQAAHSRTGPYDDDKLSNILSHQLSGWISRTGSRGHDISSSQPHVRSSGEQAGLDGDEGPSSILSRSLPPGRISRANPRKTRGVSSSQPYPHSAQERFRHADHPGHDFGSNIPSSPLTMDSTSRANSRRSRMGPPSQPYPQGRGGKSDLHACQHRVANDGSSIAREGGEDPVQDVSMQETPEITRITPTSNRVIRRGNQSAREFIFSLPIEEPRWSSSVFHHVSGPSVETIPLQTAIATASAASAFESSRVKTVEMASISPLDILKNEDMVKEEDL